MTPRFIARQLSRPTGISGRPHRTSHESPKRQDESLRPLEVFPPAM
jgi:hypothetical protein